MTDYSTSIDIEAPPEIVFAHGVTGSVLMYRPLKRTSERVTGLRLMVTPTSATLTGRQSLAQTKLRCVAGNQEEAKQ